MSYTVAQIAAVCHEANREIQRQAGEVVNFPWENTSQELRDSVMSGVTKIVSGEITTPEQSHEGRLDFKAAQGWKWGAVKDFAQRTHPDMVPYDQLPEGQHVKDELFFAIVRALSA